MALTATNPTISEISAICHRQFFFTNLDPWPLRSTETPGADEMPKLKGRVRRVAESNGRRVRGMLWEAIIVQ